MENRIYKLYIEGCTISEIFQFVGQCSRNYRTQQKLSQEKLAELSGCHPTHIGQLERGEKNATLESIEKISSALGVPLSKLFEKLGEGSSDESIPPEINVGNRYAPTLIVAPISSRFGEKVKSAAKCILDRTQKLTRPALLLAEQIITVDKSRVMKYLGRVPLGADGRC